MHLHKWVEFYDLEYSELDYKIKRIYRYCHKCLRWQRRVDCWSEYWWKSSYTPVGVEDLIVDEIAHKIMEAIEMKQRAQK